LLRDVVDRPGRRAHAGPDERALARAITGARSDGGARPRADGRAGRGAAGGDRECDHRQTDDCRDDSPHGTPPSRSVVPAPSTPLVLAEFQRVLTVRLADEDRTADVEPETLEHPPD